MKWLPLLLAFAALAGGAYCLLGLRQRLYEESGGLRQEVAHGGSTTTRRAQTPDLRKNSLPPQTQRVTYEGWIWIPAAGKYVFATHMKGEVNLRIHGRLLIRDKSRPTRAQGHRSPLTHQRRLKKRQILLPSGWVRLHLHYRPPKNDPAGLRLLWQPPGRRGDPEYVHPTFLRAQKQKPSQPGPQGLPLADAFIASALLALLLMVGVVAFRAPLRTWGRRLARDGSYRAKWAVALALFISAAAVRLFDLGGAGQTWDEDVYFGAGRNYLQNLLALDFAEESWIWNYEHPPFSKYLIGWASLWTESMNGPRALSAVFSSLAIPAAFLAGVRLVGFWPALIGGLLAVFSPHLIGHSKIAAHESPSVALFTLCAAAYLASSAAPWRTSGGTNQDSSPRGGRLRAALEAPLPPTRYPNALLLLSGILGGLALSTRWLNGGVLFLLILWAVLDLRPQMKRGRSSLEIRWGALLIPALFFVVLGVSWPRLWSHPVAKMAETFGHYPAALQVTEFFLGQRTSPPPHYFLTYFSAVIPAACLVGWALFFVAWVFSSSKTRRGHLRLFLWWLVPMAMGLAGPMKQDGIRYVLPALVPAALMSGVGAWWLVSKASEAVQRATEDKRVKKGTRAVAWALCLSLLAESVWACFSIHPYYIDYYNAFWGGTANVANHRLLEFSWWGEGVTKAADWMNRKLPKGARVALEVPARHMMALRADLVVVSSPVQAHTLVRAGEALRKPPPTGFSLVYSEKAAGVPVVQIFSRRESR